jgi:glycyl-tRNA synthetase alpha subunit
MGNRVAGAPGRTEIAHSRIFRPAAGPAILSAELTYGLERIRTFIAQVDSIYDLK